MDETIWVVRAGERGQADSVFLKRNHVAIGWNAIGDLGKIEPNHKAFRDKVAHEYPESATGAYPVWAGILYRFMHEMKPGDLVLYPSKIDRQIHVGRITGEYKYDPGTDADYPNLRQVKWLKSFPRTRFSQGALAESNSILTLFQVKNYADEFRAALKGQETPVAAGAEDTTAMLVAEQIEQSTTDFVIKCLARELKGHPFADFVANLLQTMGYRTRVSPEGPDGGVDVLAHKDELGFEPPLIKVQVKSTGGSVGNQEVSALYGTVGQNEHGLLVTLGTFTPQAKSFARGKSNLRLMDGEELVAAVLLHYEQLDSRYKGLIPLKRVYVPQPELPQESEG